MRRALLVSMVCCVTGCLLPPERQAVRPLPEDNAPLTYADILNRARSQATAANEAFYINRWADLEDAARALEQSARFLSKATDVPLRHKDNLAVYATDLGREADKLREAAKARDERQTNEALRVIHLKVRELRAEN